MDEEDPTLIIIIILIICIMIGGGIGVAYQKGWIGGDKEDDDKEDDNDACSEYTCPTGYTADSTATLCSGSTCALTDRDTCCNPDTVTCADFTCRSPGNILNTIPGNITCAADPCTETECCSPTREVINTSCTPNPCLNGGACTANASGPGHTCACAVGFSGDTCADTSTPSVNQACSAYTCPTGYSTDPTATLCSSPSCSDTDKDTCCNLDSCSILPADALKYDTSGWTPDDFHIESIPTTVQCNNKRINSQPQEDNLITALTTLSIVPDMRTTLVNQCDNDGGQLTFQDSCGECNIGYHSDNPSTTPCIENQCNCPLGIGTTGTDCTAHDTISCASCYDGGDPDNDCLPTGCESIAASLVSSSPSSYKPEWYAGGCQLTTDPSDESICADGWRHSVAEEDGYLQGGDPILNYCNQKTDCPTSLTGAGSRLHNEYINCVGPDASSPKGSFDGCQCNCLPPYNGTTTCSLSGCTGGLIDTVSGSDENVREPVCGTLDTVSNQIIIDDSSICTYTCAPGYNQVYSGAVCSAGELTTAFVDGPACVENTCDRAAPPSGYQNANNPGTIVGSTDTISCATSWRNSTLNSDPTLECQIDGSFQADGCVENICTATPSPPGYNVFDDTATTVTGLGSIACSSTLNPVALEVTCPADNGEFTYSGCAELSGGPYCTINSDCNVVQGVSIDVAAQGYTINDKTAPLSDGYSDMLSGIASIWASGTHSVYPVTGLKAYVTKMTDSHPTTFVDGVSTDWATYRVFLDINDSDVLDIIALGGSGTQSMILPNALRSGRKIPPFFVGGNRAGFVRKSGMNTTDSSSGGVLEEADLNSKFDSFITIGPNPETRLDDGTYTPLVRADQLWSRCSDISCNPARTCTLGSPHENVLNGETVQVSAQAPRPTDCASRNLANQPNACNVVTGIGPNDRDTDACNIGNWNVGYVPNIINDVTRARTIELAILEGHTVFGTFDLSFNDHLAGTVVRGDNGKILLAQLTVPIVHEELTFAVGIMGHKSGDSSNVPPTSLTGEENRFSNYITITIPSCSSSTGGECFANIGESCGKQNDNKNKNNKNKNNLLNMNNTHQNLLFVLLLIFVIFCLFKDKM